MALAVEVVSFQRTMGEYNATSTNPSIDVNTIIRNLKLRRESCTNIAAFGLASPDYDDNLPATTRTIPPRPLTRPDPGSVTAFGKPVAAFSSGANVANEASEEACTDATDTVMGRRYRQYSAYTNPTSPPATGASGHHSNENHLSDFSCGAGNPTCGKTVSTVPSLPPDGRARSLSASLPASGIPSAVYPPPPPLGTSFLSSPSSLPLPPPPPLNGFYGIAHEDSRFSAAPTHVDATAEVTMLIPSASAPAPSHLVAALSPLGSSKSPAISLPLKAISSSVLLVGDNAASTTYYPPHLSKAAVNARSYGNMEGSGKAAAALHTPVWGQSSTWQVTDVVGSDGKGNLAGDDRGSASGGGGAGLESGGGSSCSGVGGSHCASPSLRLGSVAATAFAAASAIVAATSAAATSGGRSAAAVAVAAAEAARDVADAVPGRQSPPIPSRSPKASCPPGEPAPPPPGVLVTAVSSPSRSGPQPQGGPSMSGDSGLASQRRISLEQQISRLKGSLTANVNGAVTTTNGQVNGYIDCYGTGAAAANEGALANEPANLGRTVSGAVSLATAATVSVGAAAVTCEDDMLTEAVSAAAAAAAAPRYTKPVNIGPSYQNTFGQQSPRQNCRTPPLSCLERTDGSSGGGGNGKSSSSGGGTAVSGPLSPGSYRGVVLPPSASLPVPPSYSGSGTIAALPASVAAGSTSSRATQRPQLLDELHSAHKRELALAEQLGRARAEVLELSSQLTRQAEAAAAAATAAAAEAATALELRSLLRKERADADEEIRRWRSRAAAAEEQLQTALTQLACLRSAAAAAAAAGQWSPAAAGPAWHSAGGRMAAAATAVVAADQCDQKSPRSSGTMLAATAPPALAAESVVYHDEKGDEEGVLSERTHLPSSPAGPPSPPRRSSRSSPSELDATLLRRSLSYQALCLESGIEVAKPPRAVSTSGGAPGEEGDGCSDALDTAAAGAPGDGDSSSGDGGGGGGVPLGSPPILASAAATVAAAASFSSGLVGGGSTRPLAAAAAATQSPSCRASTAAASDGRDRSVASTSVTDNGTVSYEPLSIQAGKVHGIVYGVSGDDGYAACTESADGGGGWGNWAVAANAAAAGGSGVAEMTQVQMSYSVPPLPSNMVAPAMADDASGEWGVRLEPAASATVPGTDAIGAGRGSSKTRAVVGGQPASKGALPADIAALAAVPEGADGTAVLQSSSAQPAGLAAHGSPGGNGDAASAVLLMAEVERLKQ
ncbi:hypothetical protein VaNZ11_015838, partial [Volvox africanus]